MVARRAWARGHARGTHTTKSGGAKSHGFPAAGPGGSNSRDWAGPWFLFCSNKPRPPGFVQERDNREAPKVDHYNTHLTFSLGVTNSLPLRNVPNRARKRRHARRSPLEREPCFRVSNQRGAPCAAVAEEAPALDGTSECPPGNSSAPAKTNQRPLRTAGTSGTVARSLVDGVHEPRT